MSKLEIRGIDALELDSLLELLPVLRTSIDTKPSFSVTKDQEIGLVDVYIELAPHVLDFAAALLNFLAARYTLQPKLQGNSNE